MGNDTRERFAGPAWETLEAWVREQARDMIQQALEEEVTELLGRMKSERRASVDAPPGYRNGYGKPRRLAMSSGTIEVRRPRVRGLEERFESRVLPLFQRRTREVGELIPELYLHGLAEGDFELALRGLLGDGAPLSKSSVGRLRAKWTVEHEAWSRRPLEGRELVYAWADGIYVKAGLEKDKAALLVVIGAMSDGTKEVLAVTPGYRESVASWAAALRDLKARGLATPRLLVADGNLGIWGAAREVWPETAEQRLWTPPLMQAVCRTVRWWSGALVYPACWCGLSPPARMEVRGPGPYRCCKLESFSLLAGFPDPVSSTVRPYAFLRPAHIPNSFLSAFGRPVLRRRREGGSSPCASSPPRRCAPSGWPAPPRPAFSASAPTSRPARDRSSRRPGSRDG